jgi:hypothetical protein
MLHVPGVGYSLPVTPLEPIRRWTDNFCDDERSLPRGREFVHDVGLLDASKDEVANIKGSFLNVAIMIASLLLVMTSLSHDGGESMFFEAVEVDAARLLGLSFLVQLNPWSPESDIGRKYSF